jgi:hypothetical protein
MSKSSYQYLFGLRKVVAEQFRKGTNLPDLQKQFGGDMNDYKKIILLCMTEQEYNSICTKHRQDGQYERAN